MAVIINLPAEPVVWTQPFKRLIAPTREIASLATRHDLAASASVLVLHLYNFGPLVSWRRYLRREGTTKCLIMFIQCYQ